MQIYASRVVNYDASVVNRYDTNSGVKITTLASLFTIVTSFIIQATGCGTAEEHTPRKQEFMGSNPPGWLFFLLFQFYHGCGQTDFLDAKCLLRCPA